MSMLKTYASDAHSQLQRAQATASGAHDALSASRTLIAKTTNSLVKCEFLLVSIEQQMGLMCIALSSIRAWLRDKQSKLDESLEVLSQILEKLGKKMDELTRLSVEKSLLEGGTGDTSLAEFVSSGLLEDLQLAYDSASKWASEDLESGLEVGIKKLQNGTSTLISEFRQLEKVANSTSSNDKKLVERYVDKNDSLEKELAEYLDSLTDHYDQTLKGVDALEGRLSIGGEEKKELFEVLANDYEQVPDIVSDIEQVSEDIYKNCASIDRHLKKMTLYKQCQELLDKLIQLGHNQLSQLLKLITSKDVEASSKIKSLLIHVQDATTLTLDLNKFQDSYHSLILELDRRRMVQNAMVQIIEEARSKVDALQHDDFTFRKNFWTKNGDFLPKDLYNDEKETNPLCSISVKYYTIPKINEATINNAKKFLEK